jgi:superfamily II RNA helicase
LDGHDVLEDRSPDFLLERLLGYVESRGLELYPAQEEAILEVTAGKNVILNTPTGSGKSLVGLAACFCSLARGRRAFYTAPIKALVGEKFLDLCRVFGPEHVGMMTGDASVNREAPVICCTAEILANIALREGAHADLEWVVMDEFHYYSDRDRGVAWQTPLLCLPQARFLLMSATLGDTSFFERALTERTGAETVLVRSTERPVPLDFHYAETPLHETLAELLKENRAPVYVVHFSQAAASEQAQRLTSLDFLTREQKQVLREELRGARFESPFGKALARFLPHGIGVHHAGMLPKYRLLVEKLAQRGLLKVICGTDTLGVGVNIPLRTVLFTQLCKYDGDKTKILSVRDFQQIAGRAGRRGFDDRGSVVAQAPEHVIENLVAARKAVGDPKKQKKLRAKKAPEHGYAHWDAQTFERLQKSAPEPLVSRFRVSHGMLLNVLCREEENGCRAMKQLLRECHEKPEQKRRHGRAALSLFRALVEADIVSLAPGGVRVNADLQQDFSLNQTLALYAVEVIESLDREDRNYALLVLTVIESILESPGVVLRKQVDKLKGQRVAELKQQGVEYDDRMEELAKVTHPQPEAEFLQQTFELFAKEHPWVLGSSIEPKSVARDFFELGLTFNGYVKEYGLERAEGVLLRYLSEVYRTLEQTVPEHAKTDEVLDVIDWLGGELRAVDASLLEEWQRLSQPELALEPEQEAERTQDITRDRRAFTVLVRNTVWRLVQALARRDPAGAERVLREAAAETGPSASPWNAERLAAELSGYWEEYAELRTDPGARHPRHLSITAGEGSWRLLQVLVDPEEDLGWSLELEVDLAASREMGQPIVRLLHIHTG